MTRAIDPALRIRSVSLAVSDLDRSVDFYERVLGLAVLAADDEAAELGADEGLPSLTLRRLAAPVPAPPGSTGLFHIAWLHPSRAALAETVKRIAAARWPLEGAADHGVSEALYLADPDGLGIEVYADRPRESWRRPPDGHGVSMVTLPLDVDDLLAAHPQDPGARVATGTAIGHVHLKVSDVARSAAFYTERLGFEEQARLPSAAFVSAGGYHHHVGLNSWQSRGGSPPPQDAPRLLEVAFELGGAGALAQLAESAGVNGVHADAGGVHADESGVRVDESGVRLRDPDQTSLVFRAR